MSKKNIIILGLAIIILLGAVAVFVYANSLGKKNNTVSNTTDNTTSVADSTVANEPFFYDIDGNQLNFDDFYGKPYVVLLWKSDNAESYTMINLISKYYEEYKDKINFLAINVNEAEIDLDLIESVRAANFSIPMYFDTDLTMYNEFYFEELPDLLFLNQDRKIEKETAVEIDEDAFVANLDLLINNY